MDFDLDLDDDKVKDFLLSKLEEVKASNEKLNNTLHERRQFVKGIIGNDNIKMGEDNGVITNEGWKRIYNNKYVLGFIVENCSSRILQNIKMFLTWDSSSPFLYKVFMYEEYNETHSKNVHTSAVNEENCDVITSSLKKSNKIDKLAHILVTLDQPKFTDKLSYNITGNIIFQQDAEDVTLIFPCIDISALDITSQYLSDSSLVKGEIRDILTVISCSDITTLVMVLPTEWKTSFDSTFEILCSLTKINIASKCQNLYVPHRLSPAFDNCLIMIHSPNDDVSSNIYDFAVYSRNEECLLYLLHHLHRNIPGVLIIPKMLYENYILQHSDPRRNKDNLRKFKECINREINFVNNFLEQHESVKNNPDDVLNFRLNLVDLEKNTDLQFLRICQANCQS